MNSDSESYADASVDHSVSDTAPTPRSLWRKPTITIIDIGKTMFGMNGLPGHNSEYSPDGGILSHRIVVVVHGDGVSAFRA